jgi:hypothetical protein
MGIDFETALRNAEGVLSVARDNQKMYEDLAKRWRDESNVNQRVLDRLREIAGIPLDAPIKPVPGMRHDTPPAPTPMPSSRPPLPERDEPIPAAAPTWVAKKEAAVAAPLNPAAQGAAAGPVQRNGYDRLAAKRQLRDWGVSWPLPKSYRTPSQLARQALTSVLVQHENYQSKWIGLGHVALTSANASVTMDVLKNAAHALGVNAELVFQRAYRLQRDIDTYGERGIDYKW